ncbi:MAG: 50S ribosomal protein L24 [Chthoniobacterales bacterium]|nr:50S ribosomal protein L24 [Chthoniobacterales bacterium]
MLKKKNKLHVHVGDTVKVISGNHRGSEGKVLRVISEKNQVLIEGVRMIKKHLGRSQERTQGEIIEREGPIHISNVKLIEKAINEKKADLKGNKKPKAPKKKEAFLEENTSLSEEPPKIKSSKKVSQPKKKE